MAGQALDPTGVKILDAALRVLVDFGVKRATVESVAKYASVSHMTVYRRWSGKNELLRCAVLRELSTVLDSAFTDAACSDPDDRIVHAFSNVVWSMRNHPLVVRLSATEPETLTSSLSTGSTSVMETAVPLVAARLALLETPDVADVHALADVFVRLVHSLVVVQDPDNPLTARREVEVYALRCFGPFLGFALSAQAPDPQLATVASPSARRGPLTAASLLAVLLVGAGLGATLVQTSDTPMSPDLVRTVQAPTASVSSSPGVPISATSSTDAVAIAPPAPPAQAASSAPSPSSPSSPSSTITSTSAPSAPTTTTEQRPSGDGGGAPPRPSGPPPQTAFSFNPPPPRPSNGAGPRGPGSPPGLGGDSSASAGGHPGGGGPGGGATHP